MHKKIARFLIVATIIATNVYIFAGDPGKVFASPLTSISDEMSRIKENTASHHRIRFRTPSGFNASTDTVTITFPTGFVLTSVVAADVDICHTSNSDWTTSCTDETVAATAAAGTWGYNLSGQVITLTAPTDAGTTTLVPANDYVTIKIGTNASGGTHNITNPSAAPSLKINIAGTFGDTGYYAAAIIADDQLVINAMTDPTLVYTISANTLDLGTFSAAALKTAAVTMTASTNGTGGYEIKYYGDTLKYGTSYSIDAFSSSGAQSSVGTEQFGLRVASASGGSGTGVSPYNISTTPATYALNASSSATPTGQVVVARSTGPSALTTYSIEYAANIAGNTEPGIYTTTHTWICTGKF